MALQYIALLLHYMTLHYNALHARGIQLHATTCTLRHSKVHCCIVGTLRGWQEPYSRIIGMQYRAVILQYSSLLNCTPSQYLAVLFRTVSAVQHTTVRYTTGKHSTALYSTLR